MITSLLALTLLSNPLPYRLLPGDQWTEIKTLHFYGGPMDVDMTQVETTEYKVVKGAKGIRLTAAWKLKETQVDGEVIPVPKGVEPKIQSIALTGELDEPPTEEEPELARYRIERMISLGRPQPDFWPVPPKVRVVGVAGEIRVVSKDPFRYTFDRYENGGDRPMTCQGDCELESTASIVVNGKWTLTNAPIPGGETTSNIEIRVKAQEIKLAKRPQAG